MKGFLDALRESLSQTSLKSEKDMKMLSPLVLAFVGDALYHLYVRIKLIYTCDGDPNRLHRMSVDYVSAAAQAKSAMWLLPFLTEAETRVFKRGRNAKASSAPRKAEPTSYHLATGFEALLGYLLLTGQDERLLALLQRLQQLKQEEKQHAPGDIKS